MKIEMPFGSLVFHCSSGYYKIISEIFREQSYLKKFSNSEFHIYIEDVFFESDKSYRGKQMLNGIYLGHNIGCEASLHIEDNSMYIYAKNPDYYSKIIWSFVAKYIFTKMALDNCVLHVKALLMRMPNGKLMLVFGKGSSGKTTLSQALIPYGFIPLSNTHCFIRDDYVWGINSWIRIRDQYGHQKYIFNTPSDSPIEGICNLYSIFDYNLCSVFPECGYIFHPLKKSQAYHYIRNFSASISNYDLKEEVWDYFSTSFEDKIEYFSREDSLIKNMIENHNFYKTSLNVNDLCALEKIVEKWSLH